MRLYRKMLESKIIKDKRKVRTNLKLKIIFILYFNENKIADTLQLKYNLHMLYNNIFGSKIKQKYNKHRMLFLQLN